MLVATNYFIKYTDVVSFKNMTHKEVIEFIIELQRFDIPQTLATNQKASFVPEKVWQLAELDKIKLLKFSPYFAPTYGQADSSNQTLIKLIKKKIGTNPRRWHEVQSEASWAYHISRL